MHRADRLSEILRLLRDGRLHRARDLAERLGVSLRTLYRDMDRLMASGAPVEGTRGAGYRMTAPVTLPPLNLTYDELEALHLGLAVLEESGEAELRNAARTLAAKIDAALPEDRSRAAGWGFAAYPFADAAAGARHMPQIRAAIRASQKIRVTEAGEDGPTRRTVRPLQLDYWGRVWTLTCWCETTGDFRVVRLDRIAELAPLPALFVEEAGKTLADFRARGAGG